MKKLLIILGLLLPTPALAGVTCSVPFNLTNGTTADASQVMANYNALIACLANAAAAGANSDISSINGLTTPLVPGSGGTPVFYGGTSTGSASAQVVATTTPNSYSNTQNYSVVFTAGFTSTGATTLAVNGQPAKSIFKQGTSGPVPVAANDILAGQIIWATYDGTEFQLQNPGSIVNSTASLTATDQNLRGGAFTTSNNLGSLSGGGTTTVDCGLGPLQYFTNAGNQTLAAPAHDGSCVYLMTNNGSAGTITFSGFTVSAYTGDPLTATNTSKFLISFTEINGVATYLIKTLQ